MDKQTPTRTCDDLLDRNRYLIELAQAVIDDRYCLRRIGAERFARIRARGLLLCERSRNLVVRLREIRVATDDHCRKSRRTLAQTEALMARCPR